MKKAVRTIFLGIITVVVSVSFLFACQREDEKLDPGIVISFVTGFENDNPPIRIDSVVSTMEKPATMPDSPTKPGYYFLGWFYDVERTKAFSTKDGLKGDITLYAKWEKKRAEADDVDSPTIVVSPVGIVYKVNNNNTYSVVEYRGNSSELVMTPSYNGILVTAICEKAFSGNDTLTAITIPHTVTQIEGGAFVGCAQLTTINATSTNETYTSKDGILYANNDTEVIAVGQGRKNEVELSKKVAKIGEYAFGEGNYKVTIPLDSEMFVIHEYAFAEYKGEIVLGKKITEIRRRAFYNSTAKVSFASGSAIKKLSMGEFDGYKGDILVLPSSIKSISGSPFYGATAKIDFSATGIKVLGESAFAGYAGDTLNIPYFVEETDRHCFYRCTSAISFDDRSVYASVGEYSFNQFAGSVVFPETVTNIEAYAFYAMRNGMSIFSVPESGLTIADNAFLLCNRNNISYKK